MSATPTPATSVEMLERLVGFDTVSSKSNLALIDFVETYLQGFGVASRRTASEVTSIGEPWGIVIDAETKSDSTSGKNTNRM